MLSIFRRFVAQSAIGLVLALVVACGASSAADWPQFRGSDLNGISHEKQAPTRWSATENIRWKVALPRPGNGSPIVADGRVFVTCAEDADGKQRSLYCFDRRDGQKLWVRTVDFDKKMPTHETNPYCGSTPACDGQRVVVWHGSAGLHCYDLEGQELWRRELGEFRHMWGYGTSPVLYEGQVLLHSGPGERVFLAMFNLENGKTLWQTDEPLPVAGDSDHNAEGGYLGSWTTPAVASVNGKQQIICTMPSRVNGYDPQTGMILWSCAGLRHKGGDLAYSSPVIAGELCFQTGGYGGPAMSIKLGGSGDITETHRLWRREKEPQSIGTGVALGGMIYRPNAGPGTIDCLEPETGKVRWRQRATDSAFWGSMVVAGDLAYVVSQRGETVVFRPNPEQYDEVAVNALDESCNTTPAVSDGQLFIRTDKHLVCIGE